MAFSTQKDFLKIAFMNDQLEARYSPRAAVRLKTYGSSTDTRAFAMDSEKQAHYLSDLVACRTYSDLRRQEMGDNHNIESGDKLSKHSNKIPKDNECPECWVCPECRACPDRLKCPDCRVCPECLYWPQSENYNSMKLIELQNEIKTLKSENKNLLEYRTKNEKSKNLEKDAAANFFVPSPSIVSAPKTPQNDKSLNGNEIRSRSGEKEIVEYQSENEKLKKFRSAPVVIVTPPTPSKTTRNEDYLKVHMNELENKLRTLKCENKKSLKYKSENEKLKKTGPDSPSNDFLLNCINELENEIQRLKKEKLTEIENEPSCIAENIFLKFQIKEFENDLKVLKGSKLQLENDGKRARDHIKDLESELSSMKSENRILPGKKSETVKIKRAIHDVPVQYQSDDNTDRKDYINELENEIKTLHVVKQSLSQCRTENVELIQKIKILENDKKDITERLSSLEIDNKNITTRFSAVPDLENYKTLKEERDKLRAQIAKLSGLEDQIIKLKQRALNAEKELEQVKRGSRTIAKSLSSEAKNQIKNMELIIAENDELRRKIDSIEGQQLYVESSKDCDGELQKKLKASETQNHKLIEEIRNIRSGTTNRQNIEEELQFTKYELCEAQNQICDYELQLQQLLDVINELSLSGKSIVRDVHIEDVCMATRATLECMKQELLGKNKLQKEEIESFRKNSKIQTDDLESKLNKLEATNSALKSALKSLQSCIFAALKDIGSKIESPLKDDVNDDGLMKQLIDNTITKKCCEELMRLKNELLNEQKKKNPSTVLEKFKFKGETQVANTRKDPKKEFKLVKDELRRSKEVLDKCKNNSDKRKITVTKNKSNSERELSEIDKAIGNISPLEKYDVLFIEEKQDSLIKAKSDLDQRLADIAKYKRKITDLEKENLLLATEKDDNFNNKLRTEPCKCKAFLTKTKIQLDEHKDLLTAIKCDSEQGRSEIERCKDLIVALEKENTILNSEKEGFHGKLNDELQKFKQFLDKGKTDLNEHKDLLNKAKVDIDGQQTEIEKYKEKIADLEREQILLTNEKDELNKQLKDELSKSLNCLAKNKIDLDQHDVTLIKAKSDLEQRRTEIEGYKEEIAILEKENLSLAKDNANVNKQLKDELNHSKELSEKCKIILDQNEATLIKTQSDLKSKECSDKTKIYLDQNEFTLIEVKSDLEQRLIDIEKFKEKIACLEKENLLLFTEKENLNKELKDEVGKSKDFLYKSTINTNQHEATLFKAKSDLEQRRTEIEQYKDKITALEKNNFILAKEKQNITKELSDSKQDIIFMEQKVILLKSYQKSVEDAQKDILALKKIIDDLTILHKNKDVVNTPIAEEYKYINQIPYTQEKNKFHKRSKSCDEINEKKKSSFIQNEITPKASKSYTEVEKSDSRKENIKNPKKRRVVFEEKKTVIEKMNYLLEEIKTIPKIKDVVIEEKEKCLGMKNIVIEEETIALDKKKDMVIVVEKNKISSDPKNITLEKKQTALIKDLQIPINDCKIEMKKLQNALEIKEINKNRLKQCIKLINEKLENTIAEKEEMKTKLDNLFKENKKLLEDKEKNITYLNEATKLVDIIEIERRRSKELEQELRKENPLLKRVDCNCPAYEECIKKINDAYEIEKKKKEKLCKELQKLRSDEKKNEINKDKCRVELSSIKLKNEKLLNELNAKNECANRLSHKCNGHKEKACPVQKQLQTVKKRNEENVERLSQIHAKQIKDLKTTHENELNIMNKIKKGKKLKPSTIHASARSVDINFNTQNRNYKSDKPITVPIRAFSNNITKTQLICKKIINYGIDNLSLNELCHLHADIYKAGHKFEPELLNECKNYNEANVPKNEKLSLEQRIRNMEEELKKSTLLLIKLQSETKKKKSNLKVSFSSRSYDLIQRTNYSSTVDRFLEEFDNQFQNTTRLLTKFDDYPTRDCNFLL